MTMQRTNEYGCEANSDAHAGWRAAFEVFSIIAMLLCMALSARAQSTATATDDEASSGAPSREIVVSSPDRKLAVSEDGGGVEVYAVAVGTDERRTPEG